GLRPAGVGGVGRPDRLHFLPVHLAFDLRAAGGAAERFFVQLVEVVLQLVGGSRAVLAHDATDRRVTGARAFHFLFDAADFAPVGDAAFEDAVQVAVGDTGKQASFGQVSDDRDRGLGDRDDRHLSAAGDAFDVGDLGRRRGGVGTDEG